MRDRILLNEDGADATAAEAIALYELKLHKLQREAVLRHLNETHPRFWPIYLEAMSGASRHAAVFVQCLDCKGYDEEEIGDCTTYGCSLYPYRNPRKRERAITTQAARRMKRERRERTRRRRKEKRERIKKARIEYEAWRHGAD